MSDNSTVIPESNEMDLNDTDPTPGDPKRHIRYSRFKRRILKHVWPIRIFLITLALLVFGVFGLFVYNLTEVFSFGSALIAAKNFILAPKEKLRSEDGRTNVLVMGIGGKGHEGSDLTDTILFVSVSLDKPSVRIISIPRDLWIPELRAKVNSAYYWGNQKNLGGGITMAKLSVSEVLGKKVHYGVVVDFSAFKRVIDELGGIEVNVETGFTDPMYPIAGRENDECGGDPLYKCRYESITFDKGLQKMDGETALKFVRSRHAEGDEGTDIAREARQQKVIEGMKNKLLTPQTFLSPKKIISIWKIADESVETDLDLEASSVLARKFYNARDSIVSVLIPENLLINPPISNVYDRLYVFIPSAGNGKWEEIHKWVQSVLE